MDGGLSEERTPIDANKKGLQQLGCKPLNTQRERSNCRYFTEYFVNAPPA
jgi:hypothetical protein